MKRVSMIVVALLGSLLGGSVIAQTENPAELVVKITSSDAGIPIVFTGAYVFFDGELELLDATTPHVLQAKSHVFCGIFQQQSFSPAWSPDGKLIGSRAVLEVRLFEKKGNQEQELAMGDGKVVVMSELGGKRWVSSW